MMEEQNNKLEERIFELLDSNNREDVELGVIIAVRELGEQWCRETFGYFNHNNSSTPSDWTYEFAKNKQDYFVTKINFNGGVLKFDNINIFISTRIAIVQDDYHIWEVLSLKDMREKNIIK